VKIMAIAADYPLRRFIAALLVGRLPRLLHPGAVLAGSTTTRAPKNSTLMWIVLALAAFGLALLEGALSRRPRAVKRSQKKKGRA
jgi:uncharacterized membrane protein YdjX (TVP38/TMEM64 family)